MPTCFASCTSKFARQIEQKNNGNCAPKGPALFPLSDAFEGQLRKPSGNNYGPRSGEANNLVLVVVTIWGVLDAREGAFFALLVPVVDLRKATFIRSFVTKVGKIREDSSRRTN